MNLDVLKQLQQQAYQTSLEHGFWETFTPDTVGCKLALIHSEVSEVLEAYRADNPPSNKIDFTLMEEELADVLIRVLDFAEAMNLDLAGATLAKMSYNNMRAYKHGKKL
jgi:NTP pyrophosphatase (non-canonical NTP hydrolase)